MVSGKVGVTVRYIVAVDEVGVRVMVRVSTSFFIGGHMILCTAASPV